jgi:hypothetical protein
MIALLIYSAMVGALLAVMAAALEGLLLRVGVPVRWIWLLALAAMVGLTLSPPREVAGGGLLGSAVVVTTGPPAEAVVPAGASLGARILELPGVLTAAPLRAVSGGSFGVLDPALRAGWALATLLLVLLGLATLVRAAAAVRRWPEATISGTRVRVSPDSGPAVVGLVRQEMVLPAWLLRRSEDELALAMAHEREHVRARDPWLLATGLFAAALVPWNPAAWWAVRRLRLAVEIDCDARVLHRGTAPAAYGALLIDLAGRRAELLPGAAAMAGASTNLERRLNAMTSKPSRHSLPRTALLGAVILVAGMAACEARLPTAAQIEEMDVAAAEAALRDLRVAQVERIFEVDGREVSEAEALAIPSDRLDQVEVIRGEREGSSTVRIRTRPPSTSSTRITTGGSGVAVDADEVTLVARPIGSGDGEPLFFLDGEQVATSAIRGLTPDRIEGIEVLKGDAAVKRFGAAAAGGAILIRTKDGGR